MATFNDLEELLDCLAKTSDGLTLEEFKRQILDGVADRFRGQKINIPAARISKKQQILDAAKKTPTGVVAERYGVSQSYVCRLIRRPKN